MRLVPLALLAAVLAGCARLPATASPPAVRTVEITGRFVTRAVDRPAVGVYGLRVVLLFRRADGSGWERAAVPDGPWRRHRQFDVLDETGAFRFALATAQGLSAYDEVAIVPTMETATVRLVPAPAGARSLRTPEGDVTLLPPADALRVPLPSDGPVRVSAQEALLRPEIGVPIRYAELSREFVFARYEGAPPFDLPPVRVELGRGGGNVFQAFDPDALGGTEIELNVAGPVTPTIVAHEYGHYVSFRMWGADWWRYTLRNKSLREGWGIFFSFAARAYVAQTYGDVHLTASNPEWAPFAHRFRGRRYDGIAYGTSHPDYAAVGALLWSLYDGADPSPFEFGPAGAFGLAGDNDDISGHGLALFEAVRRSRASVLDESGIAEVVRRFRASTPDALGASVDGAVDFFLCPAFPDCDYKVPPSDAPTTGSLTLRPASPAALTARRLTDGIVELRWDRRVTEAPWGNPPEAYRVYRDGSLIATLAGTATSSSTPLRTEAVASYEVRAVGGGGESYGAPSVRVSPTLPPAGD